MKKTFAYVAIFFTAYCIFTIALMPASWLMSQIKLPKNVAVSSVESTVWHSEIKQVMVELIDSDTLKRDGILMKKVYLYINETNNLFYSHKW